MVIDTTNKTRPFGQGGKPVCHKKKKKKKKEKINKNKN
jgi:hypothetical protein